jgi:hypothetical protein
MTLDLHLHIVELFLDQLSHDIPSLKACALVHSSWTHIAQMLLFTHAVVRVGRDYALTRTNRMQGPITYPAIRLHELAVDSPRIISCIRQVDYDLSDAARCTRKPLRRQSRSIMNVFRPLLEVSELRHLRLRNRIPRKYLCKLRQLHPFQASELAIFRALTTLEHVDAGLRDLRTVQTLICALSSLKRLYICREGKYDWNEDLEPSKLLPGSNVALEHITTLGGIRDSTTAWLFAWLMTTPTLKSLVSFETDQAMRMQSADQFFFARKDLNIEFDLRLRNFRCEWVLCLLAIHSLIELLVPYLTPVTINGHHTLGHQLISLTVHFYCYNVHTGTLCNQCSSIYAPHLRYLCLTFDIFQGCGLLDHLEFIPMEMFWPLDEPLPSPLSSDHFAQLERMSFVFEDSVKKIWNVDHLERVFINYFERGVVSFPDGVDLLPGPRPFVEST